MAAGSKARRTGFCLLAALILSCTGSCGGDSPNCVIQCVNTEPGHEAARSYAQDVDCLVCEIKFREIIDEVCDLGPGDQCRCHNECG